jgi:hypothetical protein
MTTRFPVPSILCSMLPLLKNQCTSRSFNSHELNKRSNVQKMHIANSDKPVAFYNLDANSSSPLLAGHLILNRKKLRIRLSIKRWG